jgi:hypothetical protein
MRWDSLVTVAVIAWSSVATAQRIPYIRTPPYPPDFRHWDEPLESPPTPAESPALVTYRTIEVGKEISGALAENETHYLQFRLVGASHCMLETADPKTDLQIAYLDDATKVAALGQYAELKGGAYFVRLRSRGPASYKLTLQCSAQ